jgi:hypothetical protein
MAVKMWFVVFWVVMACILQGILKMEVIHSSKMLVTTYKNTQHHNPEDHIKLRPLALPLDHEVLSHKCHPWYHLV